MLPQKDTVPQGSTRRCQWSFPDLNGSPLLEPLALLPLNQLLFGDVPIEDVNTGTLGAWV